MRKNKQKSVLAFPVIAVVSLVSLFSGCGRQQAEIDHKKEIVRHVVENVFNNGKLDAISTHYSTSYIRHMCESPDIRGLDAFAGYLQNWHSAYPDVRLTLDNIIVEGDMVVSVESFEGTQKGQSPVLGVTTGRTLKFRFCTIKRMENRKIAEEWLFADYLNVMQQLGYKLIPPITESTFAMVTTAQLKPGTLEDFVKIEKELSVPLLKSYKEFCGFYFMGDDKTGNVCGISIWDNPESVTEAMKSEKVNAYFQEFGDRTKDLFVVKPVMKTYTVRVQE